MPTVASVTPANGTAAVQGGTPVRVELTRLDSTDYKKVETTQADFAAGTLVNEVARVTNDLALAINGDLIDNFDSDTVGSLPSGWDVQYGTGFSVQVGMTGNAVKHIAQTGRNAIRWTSVGTLANADIKAQWKVDNVNSDVAIIARLSGLAGSENGYLLQSQGNGSLWLLVKYVNGVGSQMGSLFTFSYVAGTVYWMRLQVIGTTINCRLWADGSSEPGTWNMSVTDTDLATGYIGINCSSPVASWYDSFTLIGAGSGAYVTSGSRISPAYALSGVGTFGTGIVQFDATLPARTTLTLKISKDGTNWTTVASGDRIALWSEGANLSAESIYIKAELATADTTVTPVLSEVRLIFMAQDPALVEIDVGGKAFTVANGGLLVWNTRKYASLVLVDPCYRDVFFETIGSWWDDYGPEHVTVLVKYNGTTISTTTFDTDSVVAWMPCGLITWWWASAIGGVYDGKLWGTCYYMASKLEDYLVRGDAHWYVQFPPSTTSDAWYLIAHAFRCDTPLAGIVGQPVTHDVPASGVGNCWERSDTPSTGVVQNWTRDDHAASGVVAVVMPAHDEALSGIVGQPLAKDTAAAGIVYEVNADTAIEVRVISVEEAAFLDGLGLLRQ